MKRIALARWILQRPVVPGRRLTHDQKVSRSEILEYNDLTRLPKWKRDRMRDTYKPDEKAEKEALAAMNGVEGLTSTPEDAVFVEPPRLDHPDAAIISSAPFVSVAQQWLRLATRSPVRIPARAVHTVGTTTYVRSCTIPIHILGVSHHSPLSARHVASLLDFAKPVAVFVEGTAEDLAAFATVPRAAVTKATVFESMAAVPHLATSAAAAGEVDRLRGDLANAPFSTVEWVLATSVIPYHECALACTADCGATPLFGRRLDVSAVPQSELAAWAAAVRDPRLPIRDNIADTAALDAAADEITARVARLEAAGVSVGAPAAVRPHHDMYLSMMLVGPDAYDALVEDMADIAPSYVEFHEEYHAAMGETVGRYLLRREALVDEAVAAARAAGNTIVEGSGEEGVGASAGEGGGAGGASIEKPVFGVKGGKCTKPSCSSEAGQSAGGGGCGGGGGGGPVDATDAALTDRGIIVVVGRRHVNPLRRLLGAVV